MSNLSVTTGTIALETLNDAGRISENPSQPAPSQLRASETTTRPEPAHIPAPPRPGVAKNPVSERLIELYALSPERAGEITFRLFHQPPRMRPTLEQKAILDKADKATLTLEGIAIQTYVWNNDASRETVLLSHGFGYSAATMTNLVQHLCHAGYRVVAVDHVGHGQSAGKSGDLAFMKKTVAKLLEDYAPVTGLVAHSAGATTALAAVADSAANGSVRVVSLNAPVRSDATFAMFTRMMELPDTLLREMHLARQRSGGCAPETIRDGGYLQRVRSEVLVLQSEKDRTVASEDGQTLAGLLPNSVLHMIGHGGHAACLEDASIIAQAIGFIAHKSAISRL